MFDRTVTAVGLALILVATAAPALAQARSLPEPATMSLFGLGAAGAWVAKRFIRRK
jgi:hypothetical protein